jgi:dihydroorotase
VAIRRPDLGTLKAGAAGDATIYTVPEGRFDYVDVVGEKMIGDRKIVPEATVIGGRWYGG